MAPSLDIKYVRSQFPALQNTSTIYMDNAGGSQVLKSKQMSSCKESTSLVNAGTEAARLFINAASLEEVVLGSSTTQLLENLARSLESGVKEGDEIVVDETNHEANIGPFVRLAERRGLVVKFWKVDRESLELRMEELEGVLSERTRLVCVTHCSNILGRTNDVAMIARRVHQIPGAEICVDGVAYAPHRSINVQSLGIDYYTFSFYKVYGPHIALLYTSQTTFPHLSPPCHFFIPPSTRPYSMQPGGPTYELTASLPELNIYITSLASSPSTPPSYDTIRVGFDLIETHEHHLTKILLAYLSTHPRITIMGPTTPSPARVPTISFVVKDKKSRDIVHAMDESTRIGIRYGHFYAHRLVVGVLGLDEEDGVVRVSLVHYNTEEEVEGLVEAFRRIIG